MSIGNFQGLSASLSELNSQEGLQSNDYASFWSNATFQDILPNVTDGVAENSPLESVSIYKTIDLLGEGSMAGLVNKNNELITLSNDISKNENAFRAIYLNDVPVKNTNSEFFNYNRMFAEFRNGTQDQPLLSKSENPALSFRVSSQTFNLNSTLPGLSTAEGKDLLISDLPLSLKGEEGDYSKRGGNFNHGALNFATNTPSVYYSSNHDKYAKTFEDYFNKLAVKTNHVITNDNADGIEVGLRVDVNYWRNKDGKTKATNISFCIRVGYENDTQLLGKGGSLVYIYVPIYGFATSAYTRAVNIKLPPSINGKDRQVSVFMLSLEELRPNMNRRGGVAYVTEHITQNLNYPHSAVMASIFDARAFSGLPKRSFDLKMLEVNIPDVYDPETKRYKGNWFGEFSSTKAWTDNPAWIFFDIVTNQRYGLGKYGFKEGFVDKWNLYSIAKYCDELVKTGFTPTCKALAFTINKGGGEITIDDSVTLSGKESLLEQFPNGGTVCLYDLTKEDSTNLGVGYKRIIYDPQYNVADAKLTFKILNEVSVKFTFDSYPAVKAAYLDLQGDKPEAKAWILNNYILNSDRNETTETITPDLRREAGIEKDVVSGVATTQVEGSLPLLEPRFSANVYLDKEQDAYNALNDLASIFRGLTYWSNSYLFMSNDQSREAFYVFNNSNVKDGNFVYTGGAKSTRFTAVLVRYTDQYDSFKPKIEYIEDPAGIREYGYLEKKIIAVGTTSRSQANRTGKWILSTSQTETELIQFSSGLEGSMLRPGDVIKIQDKLKSTKRYGGRITAIDYSAKTVTLDQSVEEDIVGQKITFIVPKTTTQVRDLNETAKERHKLHVEIKGSSSGITDSEISSMRQSQLKQFTIASMSENIVTISETDDDDFSLIPNGSIWTAENLDGDIEIKDVKYRIVSILENSPNEFEITGLIYNESKFNYVDDQKNIDKFQFSQPQLVPLRTKPPALSGSSGADAEEFLKVPILPGGGIDHAYFDANFELYNDSYVGDLNYVYLFVDFSNIVFESGVNASNTSGYAVDVYRDGERIRFVLLGADNTSFTVLLGNRDDFTNVTYTIFVRDENGNLESIGLPA